MARVIVTGSRDLTDREPVWAALCNARWDLGGGDFIVVHGGARGADRFAELWARRTDLYVESEIHRADWATHGRAAGPIRNAAMVAAGADLLLAFPMGPSPGTRGCIRMAQLAGIPIRVFEQ